MKSFYIVWKASRSPSGLWPKTPHPSENSTVSSTDTKTNLRFALWRHEPEAAKIQGPVTEAVRAIAAKGRPLKPKDSSRLETQGIWTRWNQSAENTCWSDSGLLPWAPWRQDQACLVCKNLRYSRRAACVYWIRASPWQRARLSVDWTYIGIYVCCV